MNSLMIKKSILFSNLLTASLMIELRLAFDCNLPNSCLIETKKYNFNQFSYEKFDCINNCELIKCKPYKNYEFRFDENEFMKNKSKKCFTESDNILFEWPKKELIILDKRFNFSNLITYSTYFSSTVMHFLNLKGFEINLSDRNSSIMENNPNVIEITCVICTINFYTNGNLIKSCNDILESNSTIMSIFQINMKRYFGGVVKRIAIDSSEFPNDLCPLVFKNTNIFALFVIGLVDSFYKRNVLTFTDDVFNDLNSTIVNLEFEKIENINLDLKLLNPYVFKDVVLIHTRGAIKTIDKHIFSAFKDLRFIDFDPAYFRKMIHQNGIDWIKEINRNVTFNFSSKTIINDFDRYKLRYIDIKYDGFIMHAPFYKVFPDEDFCLYKDFPFEQLVILMQYCLTNRLFIQENKEDFTCTYLWIAQYFELYYLYYYRNSTGLRSTNMKMTIESKSFRERSKCNFKRRLDLCNKTDFKIKDIWSTIDFYLLNKKLQTAFKIMSYLVSIFGIVTNLLTVIIIVIKSNSDLFKEFKHYIYLGINSTFCLIILVINILSWTTECFYPFEAFCPEIRKMVFFQFFKVIFKECLTTTFRFMMNFSYVAFALNRIAVIKKDENKLLTFISKVSIKKYIIISILISAGLSVMKYFKYDINYGYPWMNYPISNEWDIFIFFQKSSDPFNEAYFIINSISDIINYVVFVLICLTIDIFMVRELRKVMNDKLQKIERLYAEHSKTKVESTKKENDEAMNKAIRMVVINTAVGILFKMPLCFLPVLNVYAKFYYKDLEKVSIHPEFGRFYSTLFRNDFYGLISDLADFFFILSISIQPLIYKRFDRKIQTGFERLFQQIRKNKSSSNSSQSK